MKKDRVPLIHSVYGSKTGINQSLEEQMAKYKDDVFDLGGFFIVDSCQNRFDNEWLKKQLLQKTCVLITGSKFFRGPPFSGGVIVSP